MIIGLTGSIIVFNPELYAWLNPQPHVQELQERNPLSPINLRQCAERIVPNGIVNSIGFYRKPGEPYAAIVEPRINPATNTPYHLDLSVLYLDPYTGKEIGRDLYSRDIWPITSRNIMPIINRLHYQLAIPGNFGTYLFGIVALFWTIDCLVSLYLTFPARKRSSNKPNAAVSKPWLRRWWNPSWLIKRDASFYRLNFDIHRAGGLWTWLLLLAFAWSSVGFNLGEQVYTPVMHSVFGMPDIYGNNLPPARNPYPEPRISWEKAYQIGQAALTREAAINHFKIEYEDFLIYDPAKGIFQYSVKTSRDLNIEGGNTILIFNEAGTLLSLYLPTGDNLGSTINSWIFALHMAKIWGLPYRLFVTIFGLFVSILSITGVYIWWKKRNARRRHNSRD
jgi:uncharacterized iron-regulated membrane protein